MDLPPMLRRHSHLFQRHASSLAPRIEARNLDGNGPTLVKRVPESATTTTSATTSCVSSSSGNSCSKPSDLSTTLPIALGVTVPIIAILVFIYLHRQYKRRLRQEDRADAEKYKSMDFGMDLNFAPKKGKGGEADSVRSASKGHNAKQLSLDPSTALFFPGAQNGAHQSTDSLLDMDHRYGPVSLAGRDSLSIRSASPIGTMRGRTDTLNSNLRYDSSMFPIRADSRTGAPLPPAKDMDLKYPKSALLRDNLTVPSHDGAARDSYFEKNATNFRKSNNYLAAFFNSPVEPKSEHIPKVDEEQSSEDSVSHLNSMASTTFDSPTNKTPVTSISDVDSLPPIPPTRKNSVGMEAKVAPLPEPPKQHQPFDNTVNYMQIESTPYSPFSDQNMPKENDSFDRYNFPLPNAPGQRNDFTNSMFSDTSNLTDILNTPRESAHPSMKSPTSNLLIPQRGEFLAAINPVESEPKRQAELEPEPLRFKDEPLRFTDSPVPEPFAFNDRSEEPLRFHDEPEHQHEPEPANFDHSHEPSNFDHSHEPTHFDHSHEPTNFDYPEEQTHFDQSHKQHEQPTFDQPQEQHEQHEQHSYDQSHEQQDQHHFDQPHEQHEQNNFDQPREQHNQPHFDQSQEQHDQHNFDQSYSQHEQPNFDQSYEHHAQHNFDQPYEHHEPHTFENEPDVHDVMDIADEYGSHSDHYNEDGHLNAPDHGDHRLSVLMRPLPADDPNENPEERANRIRSFYKEYFDPDEHRPEGAPPMQQASADYYEDYGSEYLNHGGTVYDSESQGFVVAARPFAQPVTRRAMTPPPRGPPRFHGPPGQGMATPRGGRSRAGSLANFGPGFGPRGPPRGPSQMSNYGYPPRGPSQMSNYGYPPRGPSQMSNYGYPPRGPSQMSNYSRASKMKKPAPPPQPLLTLPTPHALKDDTAIFGAADFAPPVSFRERQNGKRPDSPMGMQRPFSPNVKAFVPLASSFDELNAIPSPHQLRKSGSYTNLDFAPPRRFKNESDGGSDVASMRSGRSGRSGISALQAHNIRHGAYKVSNMPKGLVGTKTDIVNELKPSWDLR